MAWDYQNGNWVEVNYLPSDAIPQNNVDWVNQGSQINFAPSPLTWVILLAILYFLLPKSYRF